METSIQSNVFSLRPLESFQVIPSPTASTLQEGIGRELEIFVLEACEPEGSRAEMVPPPLFLIGKIF